MLPEGESFPENATVSASPPTDAAPKGPAGDKAVKGREEKPSTGSVVHRNVSTPYFQSPWYQQNSQSSED